MKKLAVVFCIMILSACSFRSPQSQFYVMNSDNLSALSDKKIRVAVARVRVPDMLDKAQIVAYDKDSSEVKILEFHRWAEVFPDVLQATVTNDLMAYLPNAYVERTYFDSNTAQYSVNIEINRIEAYPGDKVVLSAWWNIEDKNGKVLKREQQTYRAQVKGDEIADLVAAEAEAVHQMAREVAAALADMH